MIRAVVLAAVALAIVPGVGAASSGLRVLPLPTLFGMERTACTASSGSGPQTAEISPVLCPLLDAPQRERLGTRFQSEIARQFPNVISGDDLRGQGAQGPSALSRSVVASLHVNRAEVWTVPRGRAVDVYVPVSVSLLLTNLGSGEVVFTESLSIVVRGRMAPTSYVQEVQAQTEPHIQEAITQLVANAAARFRPFEIEATVRARHENLLVLDKGRNDGLRTGDLLSDGVRVVDARSDHAIAEPLLTIPSVGSVLTRLSTQPIDVLARPSALVFSGDVPDELGDRWLARAVEDSIGERGPFSIALVNASFASLRTLSTSELGVILPERRMPDYFIRASAIAFDSVEFDTNIPGVRRRIVQALVVLEVLDRHGTVVGTSWGIGRFDDDLVDDMAFTQEQRRESAVRNAVNEATRNLADSFRAEDLRILLSSFGEAPSAIDPTGAIGLNEAYTVYRPLRRVNGIDSQVAIPIAGLRSNALRGDAVEFVQTGPSAVAFRRGDFIEAATVSGVKARRVYAPCTDSNGRVRVDVRGTVDQPAFPLIAATAFADRFPARVRYTDTWSKLASVLPGQFSSAVTLQSTLTAPYDLCFEPIHSVSRSTSGTGFDVTIGYLIRDPAGVRVAAAGFQQRLEPTRLPGNPSTSATDAMIQIDLAAATQSLAQRAVDSLSSPSGR